MPTVTKVRKEASIDGTHEHIVGVCTDGGSYFTRKQVVDGIDLGQVWMTSAQGETAVIKTMSYCPATSCFETPYISTFPDHTTANNLDNLPPC